MLIGKLAAVPFLFEGRGGGGDSEKAKNYNGTNVKLTQIIRISSERDLKGKQKILIHYIISY